MKEIFDRISALDPVKQGLLWVGSLLGIVLFGYQFFLSSTWEEEGALREKVEKLNTSIAAEQKMARDLPRYKKEVEELEVKLKFALQELPDRKEIPDLLSSISNLARDAGLEVNLFKPGGENLREFYAEVPVAVAVEGTFHQIATFFDEVGHLSRIVNINQVTIKEPKISEREVRLKAECTATTFRYLDESERIQIPKDQDKSKRRRK